MWLYFYLIMACTVLFAAGVTDKWNMLIFPSRAQMSTAFFYLWTALEEILTDRSHFSSTHTVIDFVELNWCDFILCVSPGLLVVCQEIIICRWWLTS